MHFRNMHKKNTTMYQILPFLKYIYSYSRLLSCTPDPNQTADIATCMSTKQSQSNIF